MKKYFDIEIITVTKNRYLKLLNYVNTVTKSKIFPKGLIIIDASPIPNEKIIAKIKKICKQNKINLKYRSVKDIGIGYSRNRGIDEVSSKFFGFIDDDEDLPINWIQTVKKIFTDKPDLKVVCGPLVPKYMNNYWNKVWWSIMYVYARKEYYAHIIPSGNSAFKTNFIKKNQIKFDEKLKTSGEEEFSNQVINIYKKIFWTPKIAVKHDYRTTMISFTKQWIEHSYGAFQKFSFKIKKKVIKILKKS